MSFRHFTIGKLITASLLALATTLPLTAHAQQAVNAPTASSAQIESMGVRRGDYIIPYSSIPNPGDTSKCYTHSLIYSPQTTLSRAARYSASLLAFVTSPLNASLGTALAHTPSLLARGAVGAGNAGMDITPVAPFAGNGHGGTLSPSDIRTAYGVTGSGSGVIVIIDAYNYPNALSDFNTFSSYYNLPTQSGTSATANSNTVFQVVYASGRAPAAVDSGWNGEAALDVQWAHAMAPNAKIVLVLGATSSVVDLTYAGATKANNFPNAKEVSMSFGAGEGGYETYLDANFQKTGIVYFASSGDTAGAIGWPSSSPYVVGVGGTNLVINTSTGAVTSETAWNNNYGGTGGGISTIEPLPTYQTRTANGTTTGITYPTANGGTGTTALTRRGCPDVSAVGDPVTGVSIVLNGSFVDGYGGTSLSCPLTAGMANASGSFRTSSTAQLSYIYGLYNSAAYSTNFRDITSTTSGNAAGNYYAGIGYDLLTGVGSPIGPGAF